MVDWVHWPVTHAYIVMSAGRLAMEIVTELCDGILYMGMGLSLKGLPLTKAIA